MNDPREGCPKFNNIVTICAGQAALPRNVWNTSIPAGEPPFDIEVYIQWNFSGVPFMLYKYSSGLRAAFCTGSGSYMLFNTEITQDPYGTIRDLMGEEFGKFVEYTFK